MTCGAKINIRKNGTQSKLKKMIDDNMKPANLQLFLKSSSFGSPSFFSLKYTTYS